MCFVKGSTKSIFIFSSVLKLTKLSEVIDIKPVLEVGYVKCYCLHDLERFVNIFVSIEKYSIKY